MDFSSMNGYEFEQYITSLLNHLGFTAQQTSLSGDGGVDILAYYDKPFLKGHYLIQCKNWTNPVGQPQVRDLYGVVMSQRANKGILVTTSSFTDQALEFANGLNIELIDGKMLSEIVDSFESDTSFAPIHYATPFYQDGSFATDRYTYLKMRMENRRDYNSYEEYLAFLLSYVEPQSFFLLKQGLDKEVINVCDEILVRFCKYATRNTSRRREHIFIKAYMLFVSGQIATCIECLNELDLFDFDLRADNYIPCRIETNTFGTTQGAVVIDEFGPLHKICLYEDCSRMQVMVSNLLILANSIGTTQLDGFTSFIVNGISKRDYRDGSYESEKVLVYLANYTMEAINQDKYRAANQSEYKWYPYFFTLKKNEEYSIENTCYMQRAASVKETLINNWDNLSGIVDDIQYMTRALGFCSTHHDSSGTNKKEEKTARYNIVVATDYDVVIESIGAEKTKVIKTLRDYGLDYKTIKGIIDNVPIALSKVTKSDAERLISALTLAGAKCSIKEINNRNLD